MFSIAPFQILILILIVFVHMFIHSLQIMQSYAEIFCPWLIGLPVIPLIQLNYVCLIISKILTFLFFFFILSRIKPGEKGLLRLTTRTCISFLVTYTFLPTSLLQLLELILGNKTVRTVTRGFNRGK